MNCIKHLASFAALCLLAVSCTLDLGTPDPGKTPQDDHLVRFLIKAPAPQRPGTRAADPSFENDIRSIAVFVLRSTSSGFMMSRMEMIEDFQSVGAGAMAFTLTLPVSNTPTKLLFMANLPAAWAAQLSDPAWVDQVLTTSLTEEELRAEFASLLNGVVGDGGDHVMIMSGQTTLATVDPKNNDNLEVALMRSVARVDLHIGLEAGSLDFEPVDAAVYRAQSSLSAFPSAGAMALSDQSRVIAATVPEASAISGPYPLVLDPVDPATGLFATTYVSENVPPATAEARLAESTCVIVGGRFNGSPEVTYYRIDFNSGLDGHPFGQILRNYKYVFNIKKVTSPGFSTPEEAAANIANSMTVDVRTWDENVSQLNFVGTDDYAWLSTNSVALPYNQGGTQTFALRSTLPFQWQLSGGGSYIPGDTPASQSGGGYTATMAVSNRATGYTDYEFTVEALSDNFDAADSREAAISLLFRSGSEEMTMSVKITQGASVSAADRVIHVLSLSNNFGSMGTYYNGGTQTAPAGGGQLRNLLTDRRYFGPGGTVDFGGFSFDTYQTGDFTSTSKDQLNHALSSTDILIVPYSSNPDRAAIDIIMTWLEDPRHVLFVSCDSGLGEPAGTATNVTLRQYLNAPGLGGKADGLSWHGIDEMGSPNTVLSVVGDVLGGVVGGLVDLVGLGSVDTTIDGMMMADPAGANLPFVQGPFGTANQTQVAGGTYVNASGSYDLWNETAEWALPAAGSPVVPLAVFRLTVRTPGVLGIIGAKTETQKTGMMLLGVDPSSRIVYIGESEFTGRYLNTNPGTGAGVSGTPGYNSISTLMCNVWAWAANTVMSE